MHFGTRSGNQLQGPPRHFAGLVEALHLGEYDAQVGQRQAMFRHQVDGLLELLGGLGQLAHVGVGRAQFVVGIGELGIERDRLAEELRGGGLVVLGQQLLAPVERLLRLPRDLMC